MTYTVLVDKKNAAGHYERISSGCWYSSYLSDDEHQPMPLEDKALTCTVRALNVTDRSARLEIKCDGELRAVTASPTGETVSFHDGLVRMKVFLDSTSLPPFQLGDKRLTRPLCAFRIAGDLKKHTAGVTLDSIRDHHILEATSVTSDDVFAEFCDFLSNTQNFAELGYWDSISHTVAFRFGEEGADPVEVLADLELQWLHIYPRKGGQLEYGLSPTGVSRLKQLLRKAMSVSDSRSGRPR
ncbi:MAG: hypothetical protein AB8G99_05795 [Planctomycetaceae bacterium]